MYILNTQGKAGKMVVLRRDDVDLTNIFHENIYTASASEKEVSENTLTRDTLRTILSTVDTEWDKKVVKALLTYNRSYKELESLGIDTDSITRDNKQVLDVAKEWQNSIIAAEDITTLRPKGQLSSYQENLEGLDNLNRKRKEFGRQD